MSSPPTLVAAALPLDDLCIPLCQTPLVQNVGQSLVSTWIQMTVAVKSGTALAANRSLAEQVGDPACAGHWWGLAPNPVAEPVDFCVLSNAKEAPASAPRACLRAPSAFGLSAILRSQVLPSSDGLACALTEKDPGNNSSRGVVRQRKLSRLEDWCHTCGREGG